MSTYISDDTLNGYIKAMESDYYQRFNIEIVVDRQTIDKIKAVIQKYGYEKVRAAWNEYFCDPANEETCDMGKFCWTSIMNKYMRKVGENLARKSGKQRDIYFYHCENCNNQGASDTDRGDCLPLPCHYCKGRMIRREAYQRDRPLSEKGERVKQRMIQQNPVWTQIYELWDLYPDKTLRQIQDMLPGDVPKASIGFKKVVDKFIGDDSDDSFL